MFQQKKPYSAVTVTIENLTSDSYAEDDLSGIPDLVEVIKIQASGPTEAARAIRKKLKYGSPHRQIRALVLLDGLIQNAGSQFQRAFADEPLLERLRVCGTSDLSDPAVRKKCTELFREWSQYGKTPGLERVARLYKELPKRKVAMTQETSKVIRETDNPFGDDEEEAAEAKRQQQRQGAAGSSRDAYGEWEPNIGVAIDMHGPMTRPGRTPGGFGKSDSKKDRFKRKSKDGGRKPFNLEAEKEKMKSVIAESSISSTNLMNSLQTINRERERISENQQVVRSFEACKQLRRRILRYIHQVESEQWLGSLLHANDELVYALMAFEQMDHSIDADSDSDDEIAEQAHMYRMVQARAQEERAAAAASPTSPNAPDLSGLTLDTAPKHSAKAPQVPPAKSSARAGHAARDDSDDDAEEEDNPFGDSNVIETPAVERGEPRW